MSISAESLSFIDNFTRSIAMYTLEAINTPISLGIYLSLKYHDDKTACSHSVDPLDYLDKESFSKDYSSVKLLSKFSTEIPEVASSRREEAIAKFWDCETHLRNTYRIFDRCVYGLPSSDEDYSVSSILYAARERIARILGPVKDFSVDDCNFGPGSSSSVPRAKAHPSQKFVATEVTDSCRFLVEDFFSDIGFEMPFLSSRNYSRVEVVPKNFKADRVIAVEPDWNIFFQKGVGSVIRRKLRRVGIDLDYQADFHSVLARQASISGHLATVDLSSASDSISTFLCRFLLPDDWFMLLSSLRTASVSIDGVITPVRKFSSMGNGFTFELESLIFYTLALECTRATASVGEVSVFGDDLILPVGGLDLLKAVFHRVGFRMNTDKSYSTGYFRESCGAHFFDGMDCKPYFLRKNLTHDSEKYKFCNSIRRLAVRLFGSWDRHNPLYSVYCRCRRSIHRVFYIPDGYGDGGLVCCFDEVPHDYYIGRQKGIRRSPFGHEGFRVRALLPKSRERDNENVGMLIHKLRSIQRDLKLPRDLRALARRYRESLSDNPPTTGNSYSVSSSKVDYRVGFIRVPRWTDPSNF